jgi:hypothetical protein
MIDLFNKLSGAENNYQHMGALTDMMVFTYEPRGKLTRAQKVRGGKHIMDMNGQYMIISPQSDANCFYHCLAYQNFLLKGEESKIQNQDIVVEFARALKRNFNNQKEFSDFQDVQEVADFYGCNFTIYDNLFQVMQEIKGRAIKKSRKNNTLTGQHIKLQFKGGHCLLMVPKNKHTEFCEIYAKKSEKPVGENTPIKPKNQKVYSEGKKVKNDKRERLVWTYDIEAYKRTLECGT